MNHQKDPQFERVVFSTQAAQGSYSPKGFYLLRDLPGLTLMPLAVSYEFKFNTWAMTAEADKILQNVAMASPCSSGAFVTLVAKSDISIQDGKIKIARADIHGEMIGTEKVDDSGFSWFCGE